MTTAARPRSVRFALILGGGTYLVGIVPLTRLWRSGWRGGRSHSRPLILVVYGTLGAWVLAENIRRMGNSWAAVGAYNARNPALRMKYAKKVYGNMPPLYAQR